MRPSRLTVMWRVAVVLAGAAALCSACGDDGGATISGAADDASGQPQIGADAVVLQDAAEPIPDGLMSDLGPRRDDLADGATAGGDGQTEPPDGSDLDGIASDLDAVSSDTVSSDTVSSDTVSSDTVSSDTVSSDTVSSDTVSSDTVSSDAVSSDALGHDASTSDALGPDVGTDTDPAEEIVVPPACPADCDDGDPCTVDTCQEPLGCVYQPSTASCDDGNACTKADACADFVCQGKQKVCNDGLVCTTDSCDPASGCVFQANTAPCSDGNPCTITDTCAAGVCVGTPKTCTDGNPCTDDFCSVSDGCQHFPINLAACDDGKICTIQDVCVAGVCVGAEVPGCIPTCGDGTCVPDVGEACHTCPEDCGGCAGDCCLDDGELGCADPGITSCVCDLDPTCCTILWDDTCAVLAHGSCDAGCDLCGDLFCDVPFGETCATCPSDCGECVICGDGQCASTESCASCPEDCGACDGPCCEPNDTLGCEDPALVLCVCSVAPACCEGPWDQGCLDIALGPCGAYCPECGDLLCDPQPGVDETCETCPVDCGVCDP